MILKDMVTVLPSASSLIESMRSIGYSFETAIADIIDNSISAGSKNINIYQRSHNGTPYIQVLDDGKGMNDKELIEAMRLGSKNPTEIRSKNDLGRFGLGMKSASFSQCRVVTVISKQSNIIKGYQWNIDLIKELDKFEIVRLSDKDILEVRNITELHKLNNGTMVQWENFDRIANSTMNLEIELSDLMNRTYEHLALIFHRFIEEGVNISINYETVFPKDPFLSKHGGTQELKEKKVEIDGEIVYLIPYVIPHYSKLSAEDKRKAGKANDYFKTQGFYLYRNKRLIVWGDYLGLSKKSELAKNVRIKVDIPNNLDYLWEIDVMKSRANIPSKIKKNLISTISDGEIASKNVNTYRGKKEISKNNPIWQFYSDRAGKYHFELNKKNSLYNQFTSILDDNQKKLFDLYSKTLADNIPFQTIYSQISGGKEYKNDSEETLSSLEDMLITLKHIGLVDTDAWLRAMLSDEKYASNELAINFINKELDR